LVNALPIRLFEPACGVAIFADHPAKVIPFTLCGID